MPSKRATPGNASSIAETDENGLDPAERFMPFPLALRELTSRVGASADEMAAWVFYGPDRGGLEAYVSANELDPPPKFNYGYFVRSDNSHDYLSPLMGTWFLRSDIASFDPTDRYVTGRALIQRWSKVPGLVPTAFIRAKILESRLADLHPIMGQTRGTHADRPELPPLEDGLYLRSEVENIEVYDFGGPLGEDVPESVAAVVTVRGPTPVAAAPADEDGRSRGSRLLARKRELKTAGDKSFVKTIAKEEGLSETRVKQLIKQAQDQTPFQGLGETLSRTPTSPEKKTKR